MVEENNYTIKEEVFIMDKLSLSNKTILVTGAAGFIGCFLCKRLLESVEGIRIIGLDSITDYYDVSLKDERLNMLKNLHKDFIFIKGDISDKKCVDNVFLEYKPTIVVNLAAQLVLDIQLRILKVISNLI